MVKQLLNHIGRNKLCKTTDKILLAVSGGLDSMVMLDLFRKAGFTVAVAHCNFQLRGKDSEEDEDLVRSTSAGISFHMRKFETKEYAAERGISLQMAARDLRYQFFQEILAENGYACVATAHHLNDAIETVLINLARGSGLDGLTGIPMNKNRVIRPMLFATRDMLHAYAIEHRIAWREDSSNASEDYQRNFIRHKIIPGLKEINPNLEETFRHTQERLAGARALYALSVDQFRDRAVALDGDHHIRIDKKKLMEAPSSIVVLWELIKDLNFNFEQCIDICDDHQPGKTFHSSSHQLTVDREYYIIQKRNAAAPSYIIIKKNESRIEGTEGTLQLQEVRKADFQLDKNSEIAQLDAGKIEYPLIWRSWRAGDFFIPLGMKDTKKLSDFLIDLKVALPDKEKVTVLESADKIIWVVGLRIHDHFKVGDQTNRVLTVKFERE